MSVRYFLSNAVMAVALGLSLPALADSPPVQQPPEPALRNFSADEKLAIAHDILSTVPARDLADNGSSDADACRAMVETFSAGAGIQFLEPDVLTTTARPDELRTIEGQCPGLILDEATVPKIGVVRARRNFSLYFLARPVNGMAMGVFTGERWCKDNAGAKTPCPAPQAVRMFDINSCKIVSTTSFPPRTVSPERKSNYVQGVVEYRNGYYLANVGDVCEPDQAKDVSGYAFDVTSVEQVGGAPKLHCSLSTPAKARCVPSKK